MLAAETREALDAFINQTVEFKIYDGADQVPPVPVQKLVYKIEYCPDKTHIRLFFDDFFFIAIPLASQFSIADGQIDAFDTENHLSYSIKKL